MMGKIFPGVNNYTLNRLFSSVRSCVVIKVLFRAYLVLSMNYNNVLDQHTQILIKNAWQLSFVPAESIS